MVLKKLPKFRSHEPGLSADTLLTFEEEMGTKLPDDYRSFLLQFNGAVFERKNNHFKFEDGWSELYELFNIATIQQNINGVDSNLPRHTIPIGQDAGDNTICLAIKGPSKGEVYWKDHEQDPDVGNCSVAFVARSFEEFLSLLSANPFSDDYDAIETMCMRGGISDLKSRIAAGSINEKTKNGRSIIEEASVQGNLPIVKKCVEIGMLLGDSLHFAALNNHLELAKFFLQMDIDVNCKSSRGYTALQYAFNHQDMQTLLKSYGAV